MLSLHCWLLIALLAAIGPALADQTSLTEEVRKDVRTPAPIERKIFEIDRAILLELINLIRFNIHFHQESNYRWPWRDYLYPAEKEAGTALTFASTVIHIDQRARGFYNPGLISKQADRGASVCNLTGHAISGTASALELAQNGMVKLIADKHGFSQKHAISFVKTEIDRIDSLLAAREEIVASDPNSPDQQARFWQGRLLKHIRNQVLYEFMQWSVSSREVAWREGVFFALDATQNYTAMCSQVIALHLLAHPQFSGAPVILSLTANSIETVNPIIRTMAGRLVGKYQRRRLSKVFSQQKPRTMDQLMSDWKELEPLVSKQANTPGGALNELAYLIKRSHEFDRPLAEDVEKIEKLRRVADQQAISGPLIGGAKLAGSICSTVAQYHFFDEPVTANRIKLGGNISEVSGQGYSLLATPTAAVAHFVYTRKLSKKGRLPKQVFKARLKRLDEEETQVKEAKGAGELIP